MGRPPLSIDVTAKDQKEIAKLLSGGVQQFRVVLRALALLQLAKGHSAPRIAGLVPLTAQAVRNIGRRYQQGGLDAALFEKRWNALDPELRCSLQDWRCGAAGLVGVGACGSARLPQGEPADRSSDNRRALPAIASGNRGLPARTKDRSGSFVDGIRRAVAAGTLAGCKRPAGVE
jgi:hypothetical protein